MVGIFGVDAHMATENKRWVSYFTKKDAELPLLTVESHFEKLAICRNEHGSLEPWFLDKN